MNDLKNCSLIKQCRKAIFIYMPLIIVAFIMGFGMIAMSLFLVEEDEGGTKIMGIATGLFMLVMGAVLIWQSRERTKMIKNTVSALSENEFEELNRQFERAFKAWKLPLYIMDDWIFYSAHPFLLRFSELSNFSIVPVKSEGGRVQSFDISLECSGKMHKITAPASMGIDPNYLGAEIIRRMKRHESSAAQAIQAAQATQITPDERDAAAANVHFSEKDCPILQRCRKASLFSGAIYGEAAAIIFLTAGSLFVAIKTEDMIWRIGGIVMIAVCVGTYGWLLFNRLRGLKETAAYLGSLPDSEYGRLRAQFESVSAYPKAVYLLDGWLFIPAAPMLASYKDIGGVHCTVMYYMGAVNSYKLSLVIRGKKREYTMNRIAADNFDPVIFRSELAEKMQRTNGAAADFQISQKKL